MPKLFTVERQGSEDCHIEAAGFLSNIPAFAASSGIVKLAQTGGGREIRLPNGILAATFNQSFDRLITSDETGLVSSVDANCEIETLGSMKNQWIDRIAAGPDGATACAAGRNASVFRGGKLVREIRSERAIEGLAFAPRGFRLAVARYDGVDLFWPGRPSDPQYLEWKGAHLDVIFSPDGRYVVTTMQENALHGWRLADGKHMRMSGYPSKVRSLSFSSKSKWLASSGAPGIIVWPFSGKDGPMGKAPLELGAMGSHLVTRVAFHPREEVVAAGYDNGLVAAVRINDGKVAVLRQGGQTAVSALEWDKNGKRLAFGTEGGSAGWVDLTD